VADPTILPATTARRRSAFEGLAVVGRHGVAEGSPGLTVREMTGLALASVVARQGQADNVRNLVAEPTGIDLPVSPRRIEGAAGTAGDGLSFVFAGPGQWLAVAEASAVERFAAAAGLDPAMAGSAALEMSLRAMLAGAAAVAGQGDGRGILRLSGPSARDVLAKGTAIDLHPLSFAPGDAAMTWCAHVDVTLWQRDADPTYDVVVPRGFAGTFWHWLEESAAEYGIAVVTPG
jgi:heterotetrameric sarcosine oxidase gamma subunit